VLGPAWHLYQGAGTTRYGPTASGWIVPAFAGVRRTGKPAFARPYFDEPWGAPALRSRGTYDSPEPTVAVGEPGARNTGSAFRRVSRGHGRLPVCPWPRSSDNVVPSRAYIVPYRCIIYVKAPTGRRIDVEDRRPCSSPRAGFSTADGERRAGPCGCARRQLTEAGADALSRRGFSFTTRRPPAGRLERPGFFFSSNRVRVPIGPPRHRPRHDRFGLFVVAASR